MSIWGSWEFMASLDSVSIAVFLGAILVMAGILSSLLALRFGAPPLLAILSDSRKLMCLRGLAR